MFVTADCVQCHILIQRVQQQLWVCGAQSELCLVTVSHTGEHMERALASTLNSLTVWTDMSRILIARLTNIQSRRAKKVHNAAKVWRLYNDKKYECWILSDTSRGVAKRVVCWLQSKNKVYNPSIFLLSGTLRYLNSSCGATTQSRLGTGNLFLAEHRWPQIWHSRKELSTHLT